MVMAVAASIGQNEAAETRSKRRREVVGVTGALGEPITSKVMPTSPSLSPPPA